MGFFLENFYFCEMVYIYLRMMKMYSSVIYQKMDMHMTIPQNNIIIEHYQSLKCHPQSHLVTVHSSPQW